MSKGASSNRQMLFWRFWHFYVFDIPNSDPELWEEKTVINILPVSRPWGPCSPRSTRRPSRRGTWPPRGTPRGPGGPADRYASLHQSTRLWQERSLCESLEKTYRTPFYLGNKFSSNILKKPFWSSYCTILRKTFSTPFWRKKLLSSRHLREKRLPVVSTLEKNFQAANLAKLSERHIKNLSGRHIKKNFWPPY